MHLTNPFIRSKSQTPDLVPMLSRGRHRNPGKGACFMEMASFLAGERWSDHPSCTHTGLAALAREVNDHVDDEHRQLLLPMVPDVIGTTSKDPRVLPELARACALAVLDGGNDRQHGVAAVSLIRSEAALAVIDGGNPDVLSPAGQAALDAHPGARAWADSFAGRMRRGHRPGSASADRRAAAAAIRSAVAALAPAPDGDMRLVELLRECIAICRKRAERTRIPGQRVRSIR